jgi:serpin B
VNKQIEQMLRLAIVLILVSLMVGCAGTAKSALLQSDKPRLTPDATDAETAELVAGNSVFTFDLYQRLSEGEEGNLFYSPYSISLALAMTYAGARGETEQQMAATMHYTLSRERLHPAFNALDTMLASYGDDEDAFQLNVANAIWGQEGYEFLPTFLDILAENYGAGLHTVDFVNETEAARQAINDWVSDRTEEKIQDLIPKGMLDSMARLVLTNAIYFNGKWVLPFEKSNTHDELK